MMPYSKINVGDVFASPAAWTGSDITYTVVDKANGLIEVRSSYYHPSLPPTFWKKPSDRLFRNRIHEAIADEAPREGASAIEAASSATGEHVSEGGDTAESATAVIRRDAQEQPTEGEHPSSVKGIVPPRYFTQEEVKALMRALARDILRNTNCLVSGDVTEDMKNTFAEHGITDL